jgi:anaerobic selenocysteine-containing dehydrogenase
MFYHLYDTINWSKYSPQLFETEYSKWTDFEIFTDLMARFASKRTNNPIKKILYSAIHKLVRSTLTVDRIVDLGLRFGPYGKGVNPFNKKGLSLKKLKDNPHGVFLGNLEYTFPEGLYTTDKKINLAPEVFVDDLPRLKAHFVDGGIEADQAESEFDLKIISRLTNRTLGWMHHSQRLVKGKNPCELMINPIDAQARGIAADSLVSVTSRTGQIQMPVIITDDMMSGVVCMPHLWGHNRKNTRQRVANANPGVSMNDLTDVTGIDQLTGNAIVNGVPVKVEVVDKLTAQESTHEDEIVEEFFG